MHLQHGSNRANFRVTPPEKFSFKADEWKRFERFCLSLGLDAQDQENQVNALIYLKGEKEEDILVSLHLAREEVLLQQLRSNWMLTL